jgi:hypothetical protein
LVPVLVLLAALLSCYPSVSVPGWSSCGRILRSLCPCVPVPGCPPYGGVLRSSRPQQTAPRRVPMWPLVSWQNREAVRSLRTSASGSDRDPATLFRWVRHLESRRAWRWRKRRVFGLGFRRLEDEVADLGPGDPTGRVGGGSVGGKGRLLGPITGVFRCGSGEEIAGL